MEYTLNHARNDLLGILDGYTVEWDSSNRVGTVTYRADRDPDDSDVVLLTVIAFEGSRQFRVSITEVQEAPRVTAAHICGLVDDGRPNAVLYLDVDFPDVQLLVWVRERAHNIVLTRAAVLETIAAAASSSEEPITVEEITEDLLQPTQLNVDKAFADWMRGK